MKKTECSFCKKEVTTDEPFIMAATNVGNYVFCEKCADKVRRFCMCMELAGQDKDIDFHVED